MSDIKRLPGVAPELDLMDMSLKYEDDQNRR